MSITSKSFFIHSSKSLICFKHPLSVLLFDETHIYANLENLYGSPKFSTDDDHFVRCFCKSFYGKIVLYRLIKEQVQVMLKLIM